MAVDLQQIDTDAVCTAGSSYCAGLSLNSQRFRKGAVQGGTAGTSAITHSVQASAANLAAIYFELTGIDSLSWDSGTWTVRLNVTTSNMNVSWESVHICRVTSGCSNVSSLGSASGLGISLGGTGVVSANVSGSAATPDAGDKIIIILGLSNANTMSAQSFGWTPSEIITSPFTAAAGTDLVIADGGHGHTADSLALTQVHELVVNDAGHGHTADTQALTQVHNLAVQDALHGHTADNVVVTEEGGEANLVIADGAHGHTADNVALTQVHELAVQDAAHAHSADNLALTQVHNLAVGDGAHGHTADNVVLTQAHGLVVADALHGHTADNLILTVGGATLEIPDAVHAHTADGLILTQVHELQVAEAVHAHAADELVLSQVHVLVIDDAGHVHLADTITLGGFVLWANSEGSGSAVSREGQLIGASSEGGGTAT